MDTTTITLEVRHSQPTDAVDITNLLLSGGFVATSASVRYNIKAAFENEFPLVIRGKLGDKSAIVKIANAACGFTGTKAYYTIVILSDLGFCPSPNDILTAEKARPDGWISLLYEK